MEKIPSESPSLASTERAENDSSRVPGSLSHWDFEGSCITSDRSNPDARIRQSSWDSSDNDLSPGTERSPEPTRLYSDDFKQFRGSVTFEINELKKQFFETLEKMRDENDILEFENLKDKIESRLNSDRRQSPARMRRRTKSSSSSSPVLESKSHNSPEKIEKLNEPEAVFEELSTKISEFDPKFYLNNFFTEIRSKRISLMDSTPGTGNLREPPDYESEGIQASNEISADPNENDDYFCKTSRKLSKILEVEENKTDLEKSSEEKIDNSELFSKTSKNPEEKDISPLQTARSRKNQKIQENIKENKTKKEEKYKSLSYEEFDSFSKVEKPFQGSVSERSTKTFNRKANDNFISLTTKSEKTQMDSCNDKNFFLSPMETTAHFSREPNFKVEEKEKNSGSQEYLNIDLTKGFSFENSPSRKSTDRSERTHTSRTMSAKSRRSINPDSPMFTINIGKDSDRSLRIEDINTPDSSKKESKVRTSLELKASPIENCNPSTLKSYDKCTDRTEDRFELKTERNLSKSQESPNLVSSRRSSKDRDLNYLTSHRSNQASHQKKKKQKKDNLNIDFETNESNLTSAVEKAESSSSVESNRSYRSFHSKFSRSGSFIKITSMDISDSFENQSCFTDIRSPKSDKKINLKAEENDYLYGRNTSKSDKILEIGLPLEISGGLESNKESHRSVMTVESSTKESDPSETNLLKHASPIASECSLSSRSRNTGSKKSTPSSLKITSGSNSGRSKDSLENRNNSRNTESLHLVAWKELEKICDTENSYPSVSSTSSRSSWRELEMPDQQNSHRRKLFGPQPDGSDIMITPKNVLEEQLSKSRRSSRKSPNPQTVDSLEYNNSDRSIKAKSRPVSRDSEKNKISDRSIKAKSRPISRDSEENKISDRSIKAKSRPVSRDSEENKISDRSIKAKSRPVSRDSEENKIPDVYSEVEKLKVDVMKEKNIDRSFTFNENEDQEKNLPIQNYGSETENRNSDKRLSIINEVSFESLKISNENEDESCENPEKYSRKSKERLSPQSVKKTRKHEDKTLKENSLDEISSKVTSPDDSRWNELIEKFCQNSNSSCASENTFPSFSHKKEDSSDSDKETTLEENSANNGYLDNRLDFGTLSKRSENEYGSLENNLSFERVFEEKETLNLEFKKLCLNKELEEKDIRNMQKSQNLFYLNLNSEGPFGIGEFGDVTCWNACKSDNIDFEKPKDHGDGAQTQKTSEVPILHEKRVNEVKTQRNLWTELRKDFRDSKPFLNKQPEADDHMDFTHFIPTNLKMSKSDNCIKPKVNPESDFQTSPMCKFLSEYNGSPKNTENKFLELENNKKRKKEVKSTSESITERHSSLESFEFEKEDSENQEFECEITPRLSMSMFNIETQSQEDSFMIGESNEYFSTSTTQLFEKKTANRKYENEMTDLNIFLAPNEKKDKVIVKSNWLNLKNPDKEKSREQNKKIKKKIKKNLSSPKESYHEYLYSRKSQSKVPQLKLRNSNCFQNFYKRFISVFCLTSHSSSATSK